jgi:hypothetical protein
MLGREAGRELAGATAKIKKFTPAGVTPGRQLARDHIFLAAKPVLDGPPQDIPGLRIFG